MSDIIEAKYYKHVSITQCFRSVYGSQTNFTCETYVYQQEKQRLDR